MKLKLTSACLLAAIEAAGPEGTTVRVLSVMLRVSDQTIFNRLHELVAEPAAAVFKPRHGVLVATRFRGDTPPLPALAPDPSGPHPRPSGPHPCPSPTGRGEANPSPLPMGEGQGVRVDGPTFAGVDEAEVEKIAAEYAGMIDFDIEPAAATPDVAVATPDVAPQPGDRDEELLRQAALVVELRGRVDNLLAALLLSVEAKDAALARIKDLDGLLAVHEDAAAGRRYAVAFPSDLHDSPGAAIVRAVECYDSDTLKSAVVIACTPLGGIALRPTFVPAEGA